MALPWISFLFGLSPFLKRNDGLNMWSRIYWHHSEKHMDRRTSTPSTTKSTFGKLWAAPWGLANSDIRTETGGAGSRLLEHCRPDCTYSPPLCRHQTKCTNCISLEFWLAYEVTVCAMKIIISDADSFWQIPLSLKGWSVSGVAACPRHHTLSSQHATGVRS